MAIWSGLWAMGRWQQGQFEETRQSQEREIDENVRLLVRIQQEIDEARQTRRELNQE